MRTLTTMVAVALAAVAAAPAHAVVVIGGNGKADCYAGLGVRRCCATNLSNGGRHT